MSISMELITVIVFLVISIGIVLVVIWMTKDYKSKAEIVQLSPLEQLKLMKEIDSSDLSTLIYSELKRIYKKSIIYDKNAKSLYFVNVDHQTHEYESVNVSDILNSSYDNKTFRLVIKTKKLESPIIILQARTQDEGQRLQAGLDIILRNGDY